MSKILITGFEAFAGHSTNPTQVLVERFSKSPNLNTMVLPVSFDKAWEELHKVIQNFKPDWVISCGVAAKRETIDFERVALNLMDASIVDNDGRLMREMRISPDGPDCYLSDLALSDWKKELSDHFPVNISLSAGSYVCNYLYYQLMSFKAQYHYQTLFIHFPYPTASLTDETFFCFLQELIKKIDQ